MEDRSEVPPSNVVYHDFNPEAADIENGEVFKSGDFLILMKKIGQIRSRLLALGHVPAADEMPLRTEIVGKLSLKKIAEAIVSSDEHEWENNPTLYMILIEKMNHSALALLLKHVMDHNAAFAMDATVKGFLKNLQDSAAQPQGDREESHLDEHL